MNKNSIKLKQICTRRKSTKQKVVFLKRFIQLINFWQDYLRRKKERETIHYQYQD